MGGFECHYLSHVSHVLIVVSEFRLFTNDPINNSGDQAKIRVLQVFLIGTDPRKKKGGYLGVGWWLKGVGKVG